jgi:hypothetical protein
VAVTDAIVQAGKLLDVEVLDHLVIGRGKWVSLKKKRFGACLKSRVSDLAEMEEEAVLHPMI